MDDLIASRNHALRDNKKVSESSFSKVHAKKNLLDKQAVNKRISNIHVY